MGQRMTTINLISRLNQIIKDLEFVEEHIPHFPGQHVDTAIKSIVFAKDELTMEHLKELKNGK